MSSVTLDQSQGLTFHKQFLCVGNLEGIRLKVPLHVTVQVLASAASIRRTDGVGRSSCKVGHSQEAWAGGFC